MKLHNELKYRNTFILQLLFSLAVIFTRIPFTSKLLYHMDSIQFALALKHFDVTVHQPHPPGYFLYVMLGRAVNVFVNDPNTTFVSISIAFSVLTVLLIFHFGNKLFGSKCAIVAAILTISSPNLWFHGEVALSYAVESFFSVLIASICWKIYTGNKRYIYLLAVTMAIAGGVRQNTPVFLFPLCLFSIHRVEFNKIAYSFAIFLVASLSWFVPMTTMTGGLRVYISSFEQLWQTTAAHNTVFDLGWPALQFHSFYLLKFIVCGIGGGVIVLAFCLYYLIRNKKRVTFDNRYLIFFFLWIFPSFMFFLLIAIHPSVPGHVMIFLPPLLLITAKTTVFLSLELKNLLGRDSVVSTVLVLVFINLYIFFWLKFPVSYKLLLTHDDILSTVINRLCTFNPQHSVLFMYQNNVYCGLSHAIYYLPNFRAYDPELASSPSRAKTLVWGGYHQNTFLTDRIVLPSRITTFATLLFSTDNDSLPTTTITRIEKLLPGIYLAYGPLTSLAEIYPDIRTYSDASH